MAEDTTCLSSTARYWDVQHRLTVLNLSNESQVQQRSHVVVGAVESQANCWQKATPRWAYLAVLRSLEPYSMDLPQQEHLFKRNPGMLDQHAWSCLSTFFHAVLYFLKIVSIFLKTENTCDIGLLAFSILPVLSEQNKIKTKTAFIVHYASLTL